MKKVSSYVTHKADNILYAFLYSECIHESCLAVVSLHYSKSGARKAMKEHKRKALDKFIQLWGKKNKHGFKFGEFKKWCVEPIEVLP